MAEDTTYITYGSSGTDLNRHEVVHEFQERKTYNETTPICLHLILDDNNVNYEKFNETVQMRTAIHENRNQMKQFTLLNFCKDPKEYLKWFTFFITFLQTDRCEIKLFGYYTNIEESDNIFSLQHAIQFTNAIQLNNNNRNGPIESFTLGGIFNNTEAFQRTWNSLLETGVEELHLFIKFSRDQSDNDDNTNMNFTSLFTNTSLKVLYINRFDMSPQGWRNLFNSIKINRGLEELHLQSFSDYTVLSKRDKRLFKEMICENITLLVCEIQMVREQSLVDQTEINKMIKAHTKRNLYWKKYKIMKREQKAAAAIAAAAAINNSNNGTNNQKNIADADVDTDTAVIDLGVDSNNIILAEINMAQDESEKKIREEKKMKKEIVFWWKTFDTKPMIQNELIYTYLTENTNWYIQDQHSIKEVRIPKQARSI